MRLMLKRSIPCLDDRSASAPGLGSPSGIRERPFSLAVQSSQQVLELLSVAGKVKAAVGFHLFDAQSNLLPQHENGTKAFARLTADQVAALLRRSRKTSL